MNWKRWLASIVSVGILLTLIFLSDWRRIALTLLDANLKFVIYGLGLWGLGSLVRNSRWLYLLKKANINVGFLKALKIYMIAMFLSNLTPAKTGDPIRSVLLRHNTGPTFSTTVSSIAMERIVEMVLLIIVGLIGIFFIPANGITNLIFIASGFYIIFVAAVIFIMFSEKRSVRTVKLFHKIFWFIPKVRKLESKFTAAAKVVSHSMKTYKSPKVLLTTIFFTVAIWTIEVFISYYGFLAVGEEVAIKWLVFIIPISILVSIATFLPGGIGSGEVISLLLFSSVLSAPTHVILSALLVTRVISYGMYMLFGSILMSTLGKRKGYV